MDNIDSLLKEELLKQNSRLLSVIIHACGGIVFLRHFYALHGTQDKKLLERMIDAKLVKTMRVGKSLIVVAKYATYQHFGLENKSIKLTSKRILHSALVAEMLIKTYGDDLERIEKMLKSGNFRYFAPEDSYYFLNRIGCALSSKAIYDVSVLQGSIAEHQRKLEFFQGCRKGNTDKFEKAGFYDEDLFTLRSKDIYMRYAEIKDGILQIHVGILANGKGASKIVEAIYVTELTLLYMFHDINIRIYFDIYSLDGKSALIENKVKESLVGMKGNALKDDYYNQAITFHWYNTKKILLSGIDINKWL